MGMSTFDIRLDGSKLAFLADGNELLPVAVQDEESKEVLMLAYATVEALKESFLRGVAVFYSTSRKNLWVKGETSGDFLELVEVRTNCYANSLLYIVRLRGKGMCHTRDENGQSRYGCYYRRLQSPDRAEMLNRPPYSGS